MLTVGAGLAVTALAMGRQSLAGRPVQVKMTHYPVPKDNGWYGYVQAANSLADTSPSVDESYGEARRLQGLTEVVKANSKAIAVFNGAVAKECFSPLPEAPDGPIPLYAPLRNLSRLMVLVGRDYEGRAQYEDAFRTYGDIVKFANDLCRGGVLTQRLTGDAVRYMALHEVRIALDQGHFDARALQALVPRLLAPRVPLADTLAWHWAYEKALLRYAVAEEAEKPTHEVLRLPKGVTMEQAMAAYERATAALIQHAALPYWQAVRVKAPKGPLGMKHVGTFGELYRKVRVAEASDEASVRGTLLVVALELYRLRQGAYPESLDALVPDYLPEMPLDPFAGKAFRYRRTDDNFRLYSVGQNMKDDGGVEPKPGKAGTGDLVFR